MAPCPRCSGFTDRLQISTARDYRDLARRLIETVEQGTFEMTRGSCELKELFCPVWPGDLLEHDFRCTACGREFVLRADTFHGNVSWDPL